MLEGLAPDLAPRLLIAIGGVAVAFLVLIAVLLFLRRRNSPLFIKGGRAREHRLLVLDAAAVDAKRRLVLIRRDDTEHLIMIGGPTDIVIETGISDVGRPKAAAATPGAVRTAVVGAQPAQAERSAPPQRPVAAEKPVVATIVPPRATEVAIPAASNHGQADNGRRQRPGQNGEAGQNQRRAERQAARAAEAAKTAGPQLATISAAGPVLYGAEREPPAEEKKAATPSENAQTREGAERLNIVAAQAENVLEVARGRVLPGSRSEPVSNEDAIRQLEEQLDASKAEAAKAEAARAEASRVEAERAAAAKADAERAEVVRAEAARLEAARLEAQKAEAARLEAERAERARQQAERAEAERAESARIEAERAEAARAEAARVEAERVAAARAEAMARFEAARRAQAEQRQAIQQPAVQRPAERQPYTLPERTPVAETPVAEPQVTAQPVVQQPHWPIVEPPVAEPAVTQREPETASEDAGGGNQERLASDFEKLLEAELEADGILDNYPAPTVAGERREAGSGAPTVNPVQRDTITGAVPGISIEQDMARRLGEISLNKKNDSL